MTTSAVHSRVAPSTISWPRPKTVVTRGQPDLPEHQERDGGNLQGADPLPQKWHRQQGHPDQQGLVHESGAHR